MSGAHAMQQCPAQKNGGNFDSCYNMDGLEGHYILLSEISHSQKHKDCNDSTGRPLQ